MGRAATIIPRLLTRQQAALYCGVSADTFSNACPVQAIALGAGRRLERYDVRELDDWIDRIRPGGNSADTDHQRIVDLLVG